MENKRINGNDLVALGYKENLAIGVALKINKKRLGFTKEEMLEKFKAVLDDPKAFAEDVIFSPLSVALVNREQLERYNVHLKTEGLPYEVYGAEHIEDGATKHMRTAMKLPVTVAGALMPDAHQGYGLHTGGVL